jgi:transposase-like protein
MQPMKWLLDSLAKWSNCPRCSATKIYRLKVKNTQREILKCTACRKQFTVTVGTIFEGSHIPLTKWIQAFQLVCSSKKGISTHQLHRMLGITYKSAWSMSHRTRYVMTHGTFSGKLGGTVEIDETYMAASVAN